MKTKSKILKAKGSGKISLHRKFLISNTTYQKGKAFVGAAILLKRNSSGSEAFDYVVLHLLCQGIELILKGSLLFRDYDAFKPQLQKFGHDLVKSADEACKCYDLKPLTPDLRKKLQGLSKFFSGHQFRYAGLLDIFIDPKSIDSNRVFRRIGAVVRLSERHLAKNPDG